MGSLHGRSLSKQYFNTLLFSWSLIRMVRIANKSQSHVLFLALTSIKTNRKRYSGIHVFWSRHHGITASRKPFPHSLLRARLPIKLPPTLNQATPLAWWKEWRLSIQNSGLERWCRWISAVPIRRQRSISTTWAKRPCCWGLPNSGSSKTDFGRLRLLLRFAHSGSWGDAIFNKHPLLPAPNTTWLILFETLFIITWI